ncbi:penicillin-binding protein 1C [Verrucomicrobiaceae bacterium 227]
MIPGPSIPKFAPWALLLPVMALLVPLPGSLEEPPASHPVLLDRNGEVLTHLPREDYFRHQPASLDEIPEHLIKATLAAEDKRFFDHGGVDYAATLRAMYDNTRNKRVTSGASTITQQLIKITTPPEKRNWRKKLQEVYTARRLEFRWSKDEILTAYLNRLDYGSHRQGCVEAARYFFGKPLGDLSLAESALLAGLPQAPSRLNPHRNPQAALVRRNWVLDRLATEFDYADDEIARAKAEPLLLRQQVPGNPIPHLTRDFREGGRLTIDGKLQSRTFEILQEELAGIEDSNVQQGALVVIHNPTGEVLAFHGSSDFLSANGGQINGALAPRSAGSSLKPFTYALAFQNQALFPGSIIADIPTNYQTEEGLDAPKNFDRRHHGPVSIRDALGESLNVAAMRMLNQVGGPEPLHRLLGELGLTTLTREATEYGLGLTIGNAEVSLLELTNAYATLARLGRSLPPRFTMDGEMGAGESLLSPEACYLIANVLADNAARSSAFGVDSVLRLPFPCAVKTGTSSDFRDNWCLGFTGEFTVGVWVGNFDNSPMAGISGVTGAGPMFRRTMLALHEGREAIFVKRPESIETIQVDRRTGHRFLTQVADNTPYRKSEVCVVSHLPLPVSSSDYDAEGRALVSLEYGEWFHSEDNVQGHAFALADSAPPAQENIQIITPMAGATYYLDPELPGQAATLKLVSNLTSGEWFSETLEVKNQAITLSPGHHIIRLKHPETGQVIEAGFSVESL